MREPIKKQEYKGTEFRWNWTIFSWVCAGIQTKDTVFSVSGVSSEIRQNYVKKKKKIAKSKRIANCFDLSLKNEICIFQKKIDVADMTFISSARSLLPRWTLEHCTEFSRNQSSCPSFFTIHKLLTTIFRVNNFINRQKIH